MLFRYTALDETGRAINGVIDALTMEVALNSLQRRGFTISGITPGVSLPFWKRTISLWRRIGAKEIVLVSRQIATLFEAQVSALRIFRLLAAESENLGLKEVLLAIADDLQAGSSIARALAKHPAVFSSFYVSMVRSGEESGKIDQAFVFLADYLERTYEVTSKAKNALIYPIFVIITFIAVLVLMMTTVIPSVKDILVQSGQEVPFYTKVILGISSFFVSYGWLLAVLLVFGILFFIRFARTPHGNIFMGELRIRIPYIGTLFRKLYLSRIADTLHTQLAAAMPVVTALEITGEVVGNVVYRDALKLAVEKVKGGSSIANALSESEAIPGIMVQMMKVGEESGELAKILETVARFYRREVTNAVDTLVSLIEPALIIVLGLGVGFLLAAVLIPIYNVAGSI